MQAILFPFTYISETLCEAIRTCFQPVRIYQPGRRQVPPQLQTLSQKGLIDISIPAGTDDEKVEKLVRDYRSWAEQHQGGVRDYLQRQNRSIPFFDDTAVARIQAEIKHTLRTPEAQDPLLSARLFLQIAQEYDLQVDEIARTLVSTNQAERNLFMNISGESEVSIQNVRRAHRMEGIDSSGYMLQARTQAWSQLFLRDSGFDPAGAPTAFVTIHRDALDFLIEQAPAAEQILTIASLPIIGRRAEGHEHWRNRFCRIFESLPDNAGEIAADLIVRFQAVNPSDLKADWTLYRVPGEPPAVFFGRCIGRRPFENGQSLPEESNQTLLGLLELESKPIGG